jgi:hypothetical protein
MKRLIFIILIFIIKFAVSQPRNYWSVSFNSESSLLAGAVVGGNSDITSIYYNPAGISEIDEQKFALNANLFSLSLTNYKNALGTGIHEDYLGFSVQPRFISYMFKLKKAQNINWQFALFNRDNKRISVYDQIESQVNLIHPQYNEKYIGNFDFVNDYNDSWGAIGMAYKLSERLVVGASVSANIKTLDYMRMINVTVHPDDTQYSDTIDFYTSTASNYDKIVMYDVRVLGKIGVRYNLDKLGLGANITLPSFKIMGNSDVKKSITNSGIYYNENPIEDRFLNQSAVYLKTQLKEPLSVAFGAVYRSGDVQYYFTTEYFHKIETYKAIDGTHVIDNEYEAASDFLSYKLGAKSIVNFAFGCKFNALGKFETLVGFRTDFDPYYVDANKYKDINEFMNPSSDLYHFTGGSKFNYKKLSVIAGIEYTVGVNKNLKEFVNFAEPEVKPDAEFVLAGERNNNMKYVYNAVGLYFGFTLGF